MTIVNTVVTNYEKRISMHCVTPRVLYNMRDVVSIIYVGIIYYYKAFPQGVDFATVSTCAIARLHCRRRFYYIEILLNVCAVTHSCT